jgi:hypothetical protein
MIKARLDAGFCLKLGMRRKEEEEDGEIYKEEINQLIQSLSQIQVLFLCFVFPLK